ncbi:MAG: hypothetical protein Q8N63_03545 [Nanoarchaeota archaeon]|nr:hypothetical protein [Nanoarchaeota archaeon]
MESRIKYPERGLKEILALALIIFFFTINNSSALANGSINESLQAKETLNKAKQDINQMALMEIGVSRVNEFYQEASQIYLAQLALEEKQGKADFGLVFDYGLKIGSIKEDALKAKDELKIFIENYQEAGETANLSEMQEDYNQILISFQEERFEDTLKLIDQGYSKLSEVQSSQTALKMFYSSMSSRIKNFLEKNWLKLTIGFLVAFLLLFLFWRKIIKLKMRMNLNYLMTRKKAINSLIKDMQVSYFKTKKISEKEYRIKLKKFEEMLRDIERQIMVLKEELFKESRKPK